MCGRVKGASLTALEIVAHEFDYRLVYTDKQAINAFWVPKEELCKLDIVEKSYLWQNRNNKPLHSYGYDPEMVSIGFSVCGLNLCLHEKVIYLGNGKWRPLRKGPNSLQLPTGDVNLEDPLSVKDRSAFLLKEN